MFDEIDKRKGRKDRKRDKKKKKEIRDRYGKALKNKVDEEMSIEYFKNYEEDIYSEYD